MNNKPVNYWHHDGISLAAAVEALGDRKWHLLAYAPDRFQLDCALNRADLAPEKDIYEARLFDEAGELRWLRKPSGQGEGQAVYLSAADSGPKDWETLPALEWIDTVDAQYLLHDGGSLGYREYIGAAPDTAGEDGNLSIVEQRLVSLKRKSQ